MRSLTNSLRIKTPTSVLRERYLKTNAQIEDLLENWRRQGQKNWYRKLTAEEHEAVWCHLIDTVYMVSKKHFGMSQSFRYRKAYKQEWWEWDVDHPYYEILFERVVQLADLIRNHPDKAVGWAFFVYRVRFAQFEAERELRTRGVSVPGHQCAEVTHWIYSRKIEKEAEKKYGSANRETLLQAFRDDKGDAWTQKKEEVFTDKFVRIEKDGELHVGDGLEAKQDFSYWKILNSMKNLMTSK